MAAPGPQRGGARGLLIAFSSTPDQFFALAAFRAAAHKGIAFQASSPKLHGPAGNGRAFFIVVAGRTNQRRMGIERGRYEHPIRSRSEYILLVHCAAVVLSGKLKSNQGFAEWMRRLFLPESTE